MYHLGLIGYPLEHSLSPVLHQAALEASGLKGEYRLYEVPPPEAPFRLSHLLNDLRRGRIHGLNVTLPYKQRVMTWVDDLTHAARACGAVNTLYVKGERVVGDNTDAMGFWEDLHRRIPAVRSSCWRGVVLGAGGAARAVVYALLRQRWPVHVVARRIEQAHALTAHFRAQGMGPVQAHTWEARTDAKAPWFGEDLSVLLVNTTPVGMYPHAQATPWPEDGPWPPQGAVYDLVYNPRETRLLQAARRAGLPAVGGLGMLVWQAALAFERWTQVPAQEVLPAMEKAVRWSSP